MSSSAPSLHTSKPQAAGHINQITKHPRFEVYTVQHTSKATQLTSIMNPCAQAERDPPQLMTLPPELRAMIFDYVYPPKAKGEEGIRIVAKEEWQDRESRYRQRHPRNAPIRC
jgi:hypothetical protein